MIFCRPERGRSPSDPAGLAPVLLAASFLELTRSHLSLSGRMSLLTELMCPTSARPPAETWCEVSCPFYKLRAPESAKATLRKRITRF